MSVVQRRGYAWNAGILGFSIWLTSLGLLYLCLQARLLQLEYSMQTLQMEIKKQAEIKGKLEVAYEKEIAPARIEKFAKGVLGMVEAKAVVFVDPDRASGSGKALAGLKKRFKQLTSMKRRTSGG